MVTKGSQHVASSWLRRFSSTVQCSYDSEPTANSQHSLVYQAYNPTAKNDQPFGSPLAGPAGEPDDIQLHEKLHLQQFCAYLIPVRLLGNATSCTKMQEHLLHCGDTFSQVPLRALGFDRGVRSVVVATENVRRWCAWSPSKGGFSAHGGV